MQYLWAPWRMQYIFGPKEGDCILCRKPAENSDETNLILFRGKNNFIMLNSYPYNPGHLMVAPFRHLSNLSSLTDEEMLEHFNLVRKSVALLTDVVKPGGFNVGLNLGRIAGAGIEQHLHSHIVPRWQGDTNFMPVISETKVLPEALIETYRKLKEKL